MGHLCYDIQQVDFFFNPQAKADEIAKLLNENEHLKGVIEDLKVSDVSKRLMSVVYIFISGVPRTQKMKILTMQD